MLRMADHADVIRELTDKGPEYQFAGFSCCAC